MQDRFASQDLQHASPAAFDRYRSDRENSFLLIFHARGLDSSKVAVLEDGGAQLAKDVAALKKAGSTDANVEKLQTWWETAGPLSSIDKPPVSEATLFGSRMALRYTSAVPLVMMFGFLALILYFHSQGGYRQIHLEPTEAQAMAHAVGVGDDACRVGWMLLS